MAAKAGSIVFQIPGGTAAVPLHGQERTITIDAFEFTAHYAFMRVGRPTICFTSRSEGEDISQLFLAYKSNSEGFWRLAMGEGQYWKGNNYVTSTFLHMELQKLFNEVFETSPPSLPGFPDPPGQAYFEKLYFKTLSPKIQEGFDETNASYSNNKSRHIDEPIFEMMDKLNTYRHNSFAGLPGPMRNYATTTILTRNTPLQNFYKFLVAPQKSRENVAAEKVKANAYFAALKSQATGNGTPPPAAPFARVPSPSGSPSGSPVAFDLSTYMYKRNPPENNREARLENTFRGQIERAGDPATLGPEETMAVLGEVASTVFEPLDISLHLAFKTTLSFPISQSNLSKGFESFTMSIYPTTFRSRMTGIVYTFYIGFYAYKGKAYKHLAFIVPHDSGVFQNGCYIKRIIAGVYVYKPLDYIKQCWSVRNREYCSEEYAFIGSVFQGMWPLTMFDVPPEVKAEASSGTTVENANAIAKERQDRKANDDFWRKARSGVPLLGLMQLNETKGGRRRHLRTKKRSHRKSKRTVKRRTVLCQS